MRAITLGSPLDSMPGLPVEEGSEFVVKVRDGKLQVTLPETAEKCPKVAEDDEDDEDPAVRFVRKWSGKGKLLPQEEIAADPRLAYLTAKHIR
jgi:hypothetical protein